ncbi:hypothetical protein NL676_009859 [Syzygium grande]|nr:hypothetical protein NL676_009859 [Syzygium grande]
MKISSLSGPLQPRPFGVPMAMTIASMMKRIPKEIDSTGPMRHFKLWRFKRCLALSILRKAPAASQEDLTDEMLPLFNYRGRRSSENQNSIRDPP